MFKKGKPNSKPDTLSGHMKRRQKYRARRTALFALVLLLSAAFGSSCSWLKPSKNKNGRESELHALPIAPDVDYARALDLGNGRKLYYSEHDMIYAAGDQFYPIVVRAFPRLVGLSPDGDKVAFLEPFEFEMATDLYVFDVPARTLRQLTSHRDENSTRSVRTAHWFDNRTLYYLEGYRYGTVSRGGDLWRVDIQSVTRQPIVRIMGTGEGFKEIVEFEFVPDRKMIRYVVVKHDDVGSETREAYYCALDGTPIP